MGGANPEIRSCRGGNLTSDGSSSCCPEWRLCKHEPAVRVRTGQPCYFRWTWPEITAAAEKPELCTGSAPAASRGGGASCDRDFLRPRSSNEFILHPTSLVLLFGGENAHSILPENCCEIGESKSVISSSDQFTFCCRRIRRLLRISCTVNGTKLRRRQLRLFHQLSEQH